LSGAGLEARTEDERRRRRTYMAAAEITSSTLQQPRGDWEGRS